MHPEKSKPTREVIYTTYKVNLDTILKQLELHRDTAKRKKAFAREAAFSQALKIVRDNMDKI